MRSLLPAEGEGARGREPASPAVLRCQAGGLAFCLDLDEVARIERGDRLSAPFGERTVAGSGAGPLGFLPGSGGRVPVWSLALLLGLAETTLPASSPVVVVATGGRLWGLLVERVGRAAGKGEAEAEVAVSPLPPLAGGSRRGRFRGVAHLAEGLALYLDPARLHPDAAPPAAGSAEPALPPPTTLRPSRNGASGAAGRLALFSTSPGAGAPIRMALALSQVLEVGRPQPLLRVPGSPASFLGLARWREEALPVIDLQLHLGAGSSFFEGESRLLVARGCRSPQALGFPVRPEVRIVPVPHEGRAATVPGLDDALLRGVFATDEGTILVPDLDRILARR